MRETRTQFHVLRFTHHVQSGHHPNRRLHSPELDCLAMRAIWKGSISFSLINIPIALYPATRREELKFRLLRESDLSPVNYKRVAEADGKERSEEHTSELQSHSFIW